MAKSENTMNNGTPETMESVIAHIREVSAMKAEQIRTAEAAIAGNKTRMNEANAEAEAALIAGNENEYVIAKQKATEAAARVEFNEKRLASLTVKGSHPESREIIQAVYKLSVDEYKTVSARCLELIEELISESEKAAAIFGKYHSVMDAWKSGVDNTVNIPDFPNRYACGLKQNLSYAQDNIARFLGRK